MTGKPAAASSLLKRPVVVASFAIVVASTAGVGAWVTREPEDAPGAQAFVAQAEPPQPASPVRAGGEGRDGRRGCLTGPCTGPCSKRLRPPHPTASAQDRASPRADAAPPWQNLLPRLRRRAMPPTGRSTGRPMPVGELRSRADAGSIAAMEELARRLVQGIGVPKDQQAGAGWLLRAAQAGSAQSAFNVAVMYERGFVMERNPARAVEWYRKAVEANLAIAKHNLALMLRDGKGAPRNGKEAVELLQSAARQGMAASMFSLGDIYERGEAAVKDLAMAMAWFAIAAEFERQTNKGAETALARTSATRAQALQRGLTPEDLQKAEQIGQGEFKRIVEAMQRPAKPAGCASRRPRRRSRWRRPCSPPARRRAGALPPLPLPDLDPPDWPKAGKDQVKVIQQALFDLRLLRDKPDGTLGPMTRAAIRTYQRINAQSETGEPTKQLYATLKEAVARHESVATGQAGDQARSASGDCRRDTAEDRDAEGRTAEADQDRRRGDHTAAELDRHHHAHAGTARAAEADRTRRRQRQRRHRARPTSPRSRRRQPEPPKPIIDRRRRDHAAAELDRHHHAHAGAARAAEADPARRRRDHRRRRPPRPTSPRLMPAPPAPKPIQLAAAAPPTSAAHIVGHRQG